MNQKVSPERQRLNTALVSAFEVLGQPAPSVNASKMMVDALLSEAPVEACELALIRAAKEVRGRLSLPEILARLPAGAAHPDPMEAYAIAVQLHDEDATVVATDEVRSAYAATRELFGTRDAYGAREAFKNAYTAAVGASRAVGKRPEWSVSLGKDPYRRDEALLTARKLGRISAEMAEHHLLSGSNALQLTHGGQALVAALRGEEAAVEDDAELTPEQRERNAKGCAQLREMVRQGNPELRAERERAKRAAAERQQVLYQKFTAELARAEQELQARRQAVREA